MRLNEVVFNGSLPVEGYGPGFWRIGGAVIEGPALVLPSGATRWGGYDETAPLLAARASLDVLFIGTGAAMAYLPESFRVLLEEAGLGLEPMASAQAARSYNVLLSEGRRVGAALLPV